MLFPTLLLIHHMTEDMISQMKKLERRICYKDFAINCGLIIKMSSPKEKDIGKAHFEKD